MFGQQQIRLDGITENVMKSCPLARELSRALLRVTPSDSSDCHAATPSISLALFFCCWVFLLYTVCFFDDVGDVWY